MKPSRFCIFRTGDTNVISTTVNATGKVGKEGSSTVSHMTKNRIHRRKEVSRLKAKQNQPTNLASFLISERRDKPLPLSKHLFQTLQPLVSKQIQRQRRKNYLGLEISITDETSQNCPQIADTSAQHIPKPSLVGFGKDL